MNKLEKREQQRRRLQDSKVYRAMESLERYMDRYYLDAIIGFIPGWGDAFSLLCAAPFIYFSARVIKSVPLTLAVINNALRDILLGLIPFFVGDIIDSIDPTCATWPWCGALSRAMRPSSGRSTSVPGRPQPSSCCFWP